MGSDKWSCSGTEPYAKRSCVPDACPCTENPPEIPGGDTVASNSLCVPTESGTDCTGACKPGFQIYGSYKCGQGRWVSWPRCIKEGLDVETTTAFRGLVAFGGLDSSLVEDIDVWAESAGPAFRTVLSQWIKGMSGPSVAEEDIIIEKVEKKMAGGRRILGFSIAVQMHFVLLLRDTSVSSAVEERLLQVSDHDVAFVAAMREELVAQCASCALPSSVAMDTPLLTEVTMATQDISRRTTSPPVQESPQSDEDSSSTDLVPIVGLCAGLVCSLLLLGFVIWWRRRRSGGHNYRTKITEAGPLSTGHCKLDTPQKSVARIIIPIAEEMVAAGAVGLPQRHLQMTIARLRLPLSQKLAKHLWLEEDDVLVVALEVAGAFLQSEIHCTARTEESASRAKHEFPVRITPFPAWSWP